MKMPSVVNFDELIKNPEIINWEAHNTLGRNGARIATLYHCEKTAQKISIVQCQPGARADCHIHDGHETFLILDGCFTDDFGTYRKGDFVIYEPGSKHAWSSDEGALICAIWGGKTRAE
ncbi:cupin domain-containing protein [Vibrio hepatarius]|uniref:cupin domain-containing protein n=1 Tax=Vibrio hepatarius TaxID=171383 RepID=UPI001C095DE7|nr:cupin domain-containing protein [Vibrio hepatarius]MBU2897037.1 cupin domain-containing protein [Vibrio hepatarius]